MIDDGQASSTDRGFRRIRSRRSTIAIDEGASSRACGQLEGEQVSPQTIAFRARMKPVSAEMVRGERGEGRHEEGAIGSLDDHGEGLAKPLGLATEVAPQRCREGRELAQRGWAREEQVDLPHSLANLLRECNHLRLPGGQARPAEDVVDAQTDDDGVVVAAAVYCGEPRRQSLAGRGDSRAGESKGSPPDRPPVSCRQGDSRLRRQPTLMVVDPDSCHRRLPYKPETDLFPLAGDLPGT